MFDMSRYCLEQHQMLYFFLSTSKCVTNKRSQHENTFQCVERSPRERSPYFQIYASKLPPFGGNQRGQPLQRAMERPQPRSASFMILAASQPGK